MKTKLTAAEFNEKLSEIVQTAVPGGSASLNPETGRISFFGAAKPKEIITEKFTLAEAAASDDPALKDFKEYYDSEVNDELTKKLVEEMGGDDFCEFAATICTDGTPGDTISLRDGKGLDLCIADAASWDYLAKMYYYSLENPDTIFRVTFVR